MRIAIIGPVLPFRGGIAQHTTLLARALSKDCDTRVFSFSRQYPKLLFPGESDRDPAFEGHVEAHTHYQIDSINPFTWHRVVREIVAWNPDEAVIPWWTFFWAPCFAYIARRLRAAGIPVVFMCHNAIEHEAACWKTHLTRRTLRNGTAFVTHTRTDRDDLLEEFPSARVEVYPHPIYEQFPEPTGLLTPEHDLELMFFGFVRPYKGLDVLLDALALLPASLDWRLTIAGEFWGGSRATVERIERLGLAARVDLIDRYLPESEVAEYFARSTAAVLPYRSATGSGVVAVAYNYNVPVITSNVGGLAEVTVHGKTGFVVPAEDPVALAEAISTLAASDIGELREGVRAFKAHHMTWRGLAQTVIAAAQPDVSR
jgi:glycosyltransferase involved in cell wall biosynthesis